MVDTKDQGSAPNNEEREQVYYISSHESDYYYKDYKL